MSEPIHSSALISLAGYFALMLAIGVYAWQRATDDVKGYMLGGRQLPPAVAALSAGASDMSGWMLMGLPGAVYLSGLGSSWIAIGLLIGAWLNYTLLAPRLRVYTEAANDALTLPDYLAKRFTADAPGSADRSDATLHLRLIAAAVIIVFFTLYSAAGMVAGGKLFEAALGFSYHWGIAITALVVLSYTLLGGFLAVSLTDFVQGLIMLIALIVVPWVALQMSGGIAGAQSEILAVNAGHLDWFGGVTVAGLISSLAWGLGYFGQPHIIVRFMAVRDVQAIPAMRRIGMSWMLITLVGAVATGLVGLAWCRANGVILPDAEVVFIHLATHLFHPLIGGFLLAAILAAIMSTLSSQLLVSSSSLTEDIYQALAQRRPGADAATDKAQVRLGRIAVLAVTVVAMLIALDANSSVLGLVANAWAGFGAAFGPVLLLSLYWERMTARGALAGIVAGSMTVLLWIYLPLPASVQEAMGIASLSGLIYEIVPGFIAAGVAGFAFSRIDAQPHNDIVKRHRHIVGSLGN